MSSMNKAILIGNIGQDPDIRTTQNGKEIANLSLATSEKWRDKETGENKERTEWHRIVIFNDPLVDLTKKYIKKGSKLYIEGQIETRKWKDDKGIERYTTEIVLRPYRGEIVLLSPKEEKPPMESPMNEMAGAQDDEIPFARFNDFMG